MDASFRTLLKPVRRLAVRWLIARRFLGRFNFARRMEWQEVVAGLRPSRTDLVCDVGCGNGTFTRMMARKVRQVHGADVSHSSLRLATGVQPPPNCVFECADAEHLPFADAVFDKVYSICVFEHVENDLRALQEVARVLKPGSVAVLTVDSFSYPSGISGPERDKILQQRHIRRLYRLPEAVKWVEDSGLVVEKIRYLICSPLADLFYRLGSRLGYARSPLYVLLFPLLYPLAAISDRLLGSSDGGYVLVIAMCKPAAAPSN
jgi:ubiquinone/menaquinone biosynthesis C-methylase UbiE